MRFIGNIENYNKYGNYNQNHFRDGGRSKINNSCAKLYKKKSRYNKRTDKISKKNYNRFGTNFHHGGADVFDTDNTADLFKNILTHLSNRHTNPLIRNSIPTCIIHPHEYSYTKEHFNHKLRSMNPSTEWSNVLYFLPNKDDVHNTPQNILVDHEINMLYTIRLDYRLGHMAVMSMLKVLMLDFDIKDYDVKSKEELRQNALQLFRNLNNYLISISKTPLVWYMSETDKGFHFFLINKYINYKDKDNIYQYFLTLICGDIDYAVFAVFNGFCVRLSKKTNRENDYVAIHNEIIMPKIHKSIDISSLIFNNKEDLKTVKNDILQMLNVKYKLIKYFIQFTTKHFEYILYNPNLMTVRTLIREHIEETIASTASKFDSIHLNKEIPADIISFVIDNSGIDNFKLIDEIIRPNNSLISIIDE
jgi:hypothetical protein